MEILTPDEALTYAALDLEQAVLETEHLAIACEVGTIDVQVAQQQTRLAIVRWHRAKNQLAQQIQKFHDRRLRNENKPT